MGVSLVEPGAAPLRFELSSDGSKTKAIDRIHDFALSEDGRTAFIAAGLHLRCLDLATGQEAWRYRPHNVYAFIQSSPRAVAVLKSKNVFVCSDNGSMDLFRPGGAHVARWRSNDAPNMLSRMQNGDWFVGSDGYGVSVWDPEDRRRILRLRSSVRVYAIRAFPNEDKAVVLNDFGVSVLDLFNGQTLRTFSVMPGLPYVDVSPEGHRLLVGQGRGVGVYDTNGTPLQTLHANGERILTALFHPKEGHVVAGTESGRVVEFRS